MLLIKNNSSDSYSFADGSVTVSANSNVEVNPKYYLFLFRDIEFIRNVNNNNLILNDGDKDYRHPESEAMINKLINSTPREVVTQYELNDKTLKLAKGKCIIDESGMGTIYFKVPGEFGSGQGRYVVGGYGISSDYNPDDYVIVRVEDKDRIIAMLVALAIDPEATEPVADEVVQGIGIIDGLGEAFPNYPMIRSYTDEEADEENKGWFFWPLAQGNNLPPAGEIEINPIGGYGFLPSGFYIKLIYQRPEGITTGSLRANIDWGRKE